MSRTPPRGSPDFARTPSLFITKRKVTHSRSVLFQDYASDRDIYFVDAVLGGILPNLDKLVLMGNSGTYSAVFDDFYLSHGATTPPCHGLMATPAHRQAR